MSTSAPAGGLAPTPTVEDFFSSAEKAREAVRRSVRSDSSCWPVRVMFPFVRAVRHGLSAGGGKCNGAGETLSYSGGHPARARRGGGHERFEPARDELRAIQ